jgi:hypothetical protein
MILVFCVDCLVVEPAASIPWDKFEQIDSDGGLLPSYAGVMRRPLEYFGISIWSGPEKGGGYMGALADPSVIAAGGVNVFAETEGDFSEARAGAYAGASPVVLWKAEPSR